MKKKISFVQQCIGVISTSYFFWATVVLLVIQAAWIALSGKYPMAFDEEFHLGIIKLYADHSLPFWSSHPSGADAFGAVARDPSYLFHYAMSFPYVLIQTLTDNQSAQVLIMRFMNIGFFAAGLVAWRSALLLSGASRAIVHCCLLLLVLVPVVPLLAAQLNYDNMLMLLVAIIVLLAGRLIQSIRQGKLDAGSTLLFATSLMAAGIVKYASLPILLGVVVVVMWVVLRSRIGMQEMWHELKSSWGRISKLWRTALTLLVLPLLWLF